MRQVCEGICSIQTLARIEDGGRESSSILLETLFGRLGKTTNRYEFALDEEDYHSNELRYQITECTEKHRMEEADLLLKDFEKNVSQNDKLCQQFILYHKAMISKEKGENKQNIQDTLHRAICLTKPDYLDTGNNIILYSPIEAKIIYQLFLYKNYPEDVLLPLFQYMERFYDNEKKEETEIPFMYGLLQQYEKQNKYHDVERICKKAIDIICRGRSYYRLADFQFSRLKAQERISLINGRLDEGKNAMLEDCNNLYYMYMFEDNTEKMLEVEHFCERRLQCQITKPEI